MRKRRVKVKVVGGKKCRCYERRELRNVKKDLGNISLSEIIENLREVVKERIGRIKK